MANRIQDIFPFHMAKDQDARTHFYLTPHALPLTGGETQNASTLLADHPVQVFLGDNDACTLTNGTSGENARVLLDFGREIHGSVRLTVSTIRAAGDRADVRVRFGESVMEALAPIGHKNATNDHAIRDRVYNLGQWSTTETNESGFRFVLVELLSSDAEIKLCSVHGVLVIRDIPYIGSFECSDPLLEKIWKTAAYTVHLNMQNYLWDGIKRDRLVWIGDMHTEVLTIQSVFGANPVVPKSLDFLRDGTPPEVWMCGISSYSLWWVLVHYDWFMYTGDRAYLQQQHAYLVRLMKNIIAQVDENGREKMPEGRFIDWPNNADEQAKHAGLQGLLLITVERGAALLNELGEKTLAADCACVATRMRTHVPDPGMSKQAASFLSLSGLADAKKINETVLIPGGAKGYSTFLGYYTLAAKALADDDQGALDDMRAYWGGMLRMGATTFWEDFDIDWMKNAGRIDEVVPADKVDIHGDWGAYCYVKFRHSLCHGWSSGPVPYLARNVLGIAIEEPGCKKMRITPNLADLSYARGSFPTPLGTLFVSHRRAADGTIETEYTAPDGMEIILC